MSLNIERVVVRLDKVNTTIASNYTATCKEYSEEAAASAASSLSYSGAAQSYASQAGEAYSQTILAAQVNFDAVETVNAAVIDATASALAASSSSDTAVDAANTATTKAGEAATYASTVSASVSTCATSADTCSTKAGEALASANAAAISEANAATYGSAIAPHIANKSNPHEVTATQVGATPIAHATDTDNPHSVTLSQLGVTALSSIGSDGTVLTANSLESGGLSWSTPSSGSSDIATQNYTATATSGQTVITPSFTWSATLSGTALYLSGVKQAPGSYTVQSSGDVATSVTLSEALVGGEVIDFSVIDLTAIQSLQGIVDTLALQSTQITNAGMGVWSNGTLESAVSSINLITNGEFETDTSGWTAGNSATLSRDTTTCQNGAACLKITNAGATNGYAYYPVSVVQGRVYKLVGYAKLGTCTGLGLMVGTAPGIYDILMVSTTTTGSFIKLEGTFEAPATGTVYVDCWNASNSGGTCYYDSITMYDMGANLVTNGTFNSNTTGWTSYNSAALASVAGGINGNCAQLTETSGGRYYQSISGLVIGKLYRYGLWMKNGTTIPMFFIGSEVAISDIIDLRPSTLSSWAYYSGIFEATTETIFVQMAAQAVATALFDSITLTEVTVGCVDYNTKALDLWTKDLAAVCWRETINTKSGAYYALRVYNGAVYWSDGGRAAKPEFYSKYAGRAAAKGMWVRCSSANKARIGITDSAGTTWSSYHSGGGSYEWLEVTRTPGTGITSFYVALDSGTGTEAHFSQPQLMFGTSVGIGNFVPIPGEVIRFENVLSQKFNWASKSAQNTFISHNVATDSNGVLPRGAKSILLAVTYVDTAAAGLFSLGMTPGDSTSYINGNSQLMILTTVANTYVSGTAIARLDGAGNIYPGWTANGTNTVYIRMAYSGVQL